MVTREETRHLQNSVKGGKNDIRKVFLTINKSDIPARLVTVASKQHEEVHPAGQFAG
jgi:hypothetical protein